MKHLIFIDTNIFLDFYRQRKTDLALSQLRHIEQNIGEIITGNEVEMEFKKNRQKIIQETLKTAKTMSAGEYAPPVFLSESKAAEKIINSIKHVNTRIKEFEKRAQRVIEAPSRYDRVWKVLQKLFRDENPMNLNREKKERFRIRKLALKRFILGYPPRKDKDISIGDSYNWEWIVECARKRNRGVVIVSRDSDYGVKSGDSFIVNDWLKKEFSERVSARQKLILTNSLSEGFKLASIVNVDQSEIEKDKQAISIEQTDDEMRLKKLIENLQGVADLSAYISTKIQPPAAPIKESEK